MRKSIYTREYACFLRQLRQLRKDADVTQTQLAKRLKQTQSYVSKVERGELRIDIVQLKSICTALRVDFLEFVADFDAATRKS